MSINTNDLRALADWLDEHPAVNRHLCGTWPHATIYSSGAAEWPALLAELGSFEKGEGYDGGHLEATKHFGDTVHVVLQIRKEHTCERVQVGEREVEQEVYPDDVKPTVRKVTEPVYEWVCPESWLRDTGQLVS